MRKAGHYQITGIIHLLSGTRIGGSDELLDIGATDLTVIKDPETMEPYLPGSSLKGKMRSQLELTFGLIASGGEPFGGPAKGQILAPPGHLVSCIFGPHKNTKHELGPTRILVRDGLLLSGGRIETKPEVTSNRNTGVGKNPRKMERVAPGSQFRLKIDLQVFDLDLNHNSCRYNGRKGGEAMLEFVKAGLRLVELTGIGAGVSRGSGEVEFRELKVDGTPFTLPPQVPTE